jgi:4-amino-4-deoxy-L-arabinose transferase-like glycosyltransferase
MALTYRFLGPDQFMVYRWQLLLGALVNALIFLIGLRLFGGIAGLLAAIVVMLSGPVMVFDMVLLRTTLTVFLSVLLLHLYLRALDRPERWRMVAFGVASGFTLLAQSYLILFIVPAWGWLAWTLRGQRRALGSSLAAYGLALLAVMAPLFIRNAIVGVPWGSVASNGAIAQPMDAFFVHNATLVRIMHESGGSFGKAVVESLRTFDDAADLWRIYRQKIDGLFMWWEAPNNMNYYAFKEYSPLLKSLPAPYHGVAPLAIAGFLFGLWRFRTASMPLLLMALTCAAPLIIGSSLARYRVPFVVIAALPAAWLLVEILRLLLAYRWKELAAATVLAALAFWYTSGLPTKLVFPYHGSDFLVPYKSLYLQRLTDLEKAKDDEGYLKLTTEFLSYLPDHFFEVKVTDPILVSKEAETSRLIARFVDMHAGVLFALGRQREAAEFQERSRILRTRAEEFDQRIARKRAPQAPAPGNTPGS